MWRSSFLIAGDGGYALPFVDSKQEDGDPPAAAIAFKIGKSGNGRKTSFPPFLSIRLVEYVRHTLEQRRRTATDGASGDAA